MNNLSDLIIGRRRLIERERKKVRRMKGSNVVW